MCWGTWWEVGGWVSSFSCFFSLCECFVSSVVCACLCVFVIYPEKRKGRLDGIYLSLSIWLAKRAVGGSGSGRLAGNCVCRAKMGVLCSGRGLHGLMLREGRRDGRGGLDWIGAGWGEKREWVKHGVGLWVDGVME